MTGTKRGCDTIRDPSIFASKVEETHANAKTGCERPLVERPAAAARGSSPAPWPPWPLRWVTSPRVNAWKGLLTLRLLPSSPKLALRPATLFPSSILLRTTSCHAPRQLGSLTTDPPRPPVFRSPWSIPQLLPPVRGPPARLSRLSRPCPLQPRPLPSASPRCQDPCPKERPASPRPWRPPAAFGSPVAALAGASPQLPHLSLGPGIISFVDASCLPSAMSFLRAGIELIHLCTPHRDPHNLSLAVTPGPTNRGRQSRSPCGYPCPASAHLRHLGVETGNRGSRGQQGTESKAQGSPAGRRAGWG